MPKGFQASSFLVLFVYFNKSNLESMRAGRTGTMYVISAVLQFPIAYNICRTLFLSGHEFRNNDRPE